MYIDGIVNKRQAFVWYRYDTGHGSDEVMDDAIERSRDEEEG